MQPALVVFIVVLLAQLAVALISYLLTRKPAAEVAAAAEAKRLAAELRTLDVQAHFVAYSLTQRKIVKVEKELEALRRQTADAWAATPLPRVAPLLTPAALVGLWLAFRGAPMLTLPPALFAPLQGMLARADGTVGAFVWITACQSVAARAVPAALAATGVLPPPEKKDLVSLARSWVGL